MKEVPFSGARPDVAGLSVCLELDALLNASVSAWLSWLQPPLLVPLYHHRLGPSQPIALSPIRKAVTAAIFRAALALGHNACVTL